MEKIMWLLERAKPMFVRHIESMAPDTAKWIQYRGLYDRCGHTWLQFGSSQAPVGFKIRLGMISEEEDFLLSHHSAEVYDYFKNIKYKTL